MSNSPFPSIPRSTYRPGNIGTPKSDDTTLPQTFAARTEEIKMAAANRSNKSNGKSSDNLFPKLAPATPSAEQPKLVDVPATVNQDGVIVTPGGNPQPAPKDAADRAAAFDATLSISPDVRTMIARDWVDALDRPTVDYRGEIVTSVQSNGTGYILRTDKNEYAVAADAILTVVEPSVPLGSDGQPSTNVDDWLDRAEKPATPKRRSIDGNVFQAWFRGFAAKTGWTDDQVFQALSKYKQDRGHGAVISLVDWEDTMPALVQVVENAYINNINKNPGEEMFPERVLIKGIGETTPQPAAETPVHPEPTKDTAKVEATAQPQATTAKQATPQKSQATAPKNYHLTESEIRAKYTSKLQGGKEYLQVAGRILLFRTENPKGQIITDLLSIDERGVMFKATIFDDSGAMLATGYARTEFVNSKNFSGRALEKSETSAIGRALAHAGYGTDAAGEDVDEEDQLSDSPVKAA